MRWLARCVQNVANILFLLAQMGGCAQNAVIEWYCLRMMEKAEEDKSVLIVENSKFLIAFVEIVGHNFLIGRRTIKWNQKENKIKH